MICRPNIRVQMAHRWKCYLLAIFLTTVAIWLAQHLFFRVRPLFYAPGSQIPYPFQSLRILLMHGDLNPCYSKTRGLNRVEFLCSGGSMEYSRLTLYTTMHYREEKQHINENTLRAWTLLMPMANFVLFVEPSNGSATGVGDRILVQTACALGWHVVKVNDCNYLGYPTFKAMAQLVLNTWDSTWYGYVNGDIILSSGLYETLDFLDRLRPTTNFSIITGIRSNVDVSVDDQVHTIQDIEQLERQSVRDWPCGNDYFIFTKQFDWSSVPPFVVGRVGYDNWMIWHFREHHILAMDTSDSIVAIHQCLPGVRKESKSIHAGATYNAELVQQWDQHYGITNTMQYLLRRFDNGTSVILERHLATVKDNPVCGTVGFKTVRTEVLYKSLSP